MTYLVRILCLAAVPALFIACERKPQTTGEKIEDKVNDALDRRPAEKVRDAAEDMKDAVN